MRKKTPIAHRLFSVAGLALITLLAVGLLGASAWYVRGFLQSDQMAAVISAVLVDLVNNDRTDEGLGQLTVNPTLVAAAQAKADDMAAKGYFSHTSPDGRNSWSWFKEAGYSFVYAGENLAVDFSDSEDVEKAWMNSPTHRANIMNGRFTEVGIASAVGTYKGHTTTFVVQMFGAPSARAATSATVREVTAPARAEEIAVATTDVLGASQGIDEPVVTSAAEKVKTSVDVTPKHATDVKSSTTTVARTDDTHASLWQQLLTTPKVVLRDIYLVSALLILVALIRTTGFEFRKHHMRHVAAASFLFVLMGGLFFAADMIVFREPVVGTTGASIGA